MDNFEDDFTKQNPASNGACFTTDNKKNTPKQNKRQRKNGFALEIRIHSDNPKDIPVVLVVSGKPAYSLWHLYTRKGGLSRADALSKYFILCLTQHVHFFRHELDLEIFTEKVPPTGYGIYHLITPLSIRILSGEVK